MANTLKFGNGQWATKVGSTLAYNDEGGNFKPLPFNFTRSTGGTRVNKDGLIEVVTNNKPRIDFLNDSNGALLLEPSRTNLATYSEQFDNAAWTKFGGVVLANTETSPDGAINSDTLEGDGSTVQIIISQGKTLSAGQFTSSIFAKAGTANFLELTFDNFVGASNISGVFDLSNGTTSSVGAIIQSFNNGWYRCSLTATIVSGDVVGSLGYRIRPNAANIFYPNAAATNGQNVFLYGAQIEAGSYATSYIPTQGATATRVAEVCNQTPPSGIIGQTEGTIFAHFKRNGNIVSRGGVVFLREDFLRGLSINYINNTLYAISRNDAATTTVVLKTPFDINETAKVAITYNGSVFSGFLNGVKIFTDSVFNPFDTIVTEIRVSYGANSGSDIEIAPNSMKDVRVYTTVLTDQECINLTTL
jgi:hypothetical protein